MAKTTTLLILLLLSSLLSQVYAESFPISPFTAQYTISRNNLSIAESTRQLTHETDSRYIFSSKTRTTGIASLFIKDTVLEQSIWHFSDQKLVPEQYLYQRNGGKKERDIHLRFDWDKMRVINTIDKDPWAMPIPKGTLDKYLYQLQVMFDLLQGKEQLAYQIADGGKLKDYILDVAGQETIETKLGKLETVILKRRDDKRQTTLWCAKSLDYLPVKITQIEKDGALFEASIKTFSK